ncbi:MAG TPA: hypothetical protein VGR85_05860 [Candidatus Limnocylindria bacterium]|jgi:hypothetical protein|nr:hypothetical protein [Candidatus Limnocylindria bacterium]
MSKGGSRLAVTVRRVREGGLSGGGVELSLCKARRVRISSERSPSELRAMQPAYLAVERGDVIIRRGAGVIAVVLTEVAEIRACIEEHGVRFEADLPRTTNEMVVPVRPLEAR